MPPGPSPYDLRTTIAERWRSEVMGSPTEPRKHWKTKVAYYRAVCEALSMAQGSPLTWRAVVAAVRPHGSGSTFYEVAGPKAKHPLIDAYRDATDADALQLAITYRRGSAIEQLIDEAKVWSFWDYREAYLRGLPRATVPPADAFVRTLAAWAGLNRTLAAALHFAPPVCAVEDFVTLHRGALAAFRAQRQLTEVVREASYQPDEPTLAGSIERDGFATQLYAHEFGRHGSPTQQHRFAEMGR